LSEDARALQVYLYNSYKHVSQVLNHKRGSAFFCLLACSLACLLARSCASACWHCCRVATDVDGESAHVLIFCESLAAHANNCLDGSFFHGAGACAVDQAFGASACRWRACGQSKGRGGDRGTPYVDCHRCSRITGLLFLLRFLGTIPGSALWFPFINVCYCLLVDSHQSRFWVGTVDYKLQQFNSRFLCFNCFGLRPGAVVAGAHYLARHHPDQERGRRALREYLDERPNEAALQMPCCSADSMATTRTALNKQSPLLFLCGWKLAADRA
jgi:hypothetical protein